MKTVMRSWLFLLLAALSMSSSAHAEKASRYQTIYFGVGIGGALTVPFGDRSFVSTERDFGSAGGFELNLLLDITHWIELDGYFRVTNGMARVDAWAASPEELVGETATGGTSKDTQIGTRVQVFPFRDRRSRPCFGLGFQHNVLGLLGELRPNNDPYNCVGPGCSDSKYERDRLFVEGTGIELSATCRYEFATENKPVRNQWVDIYPIWIRVAYTSNRWFTFAFEAASGEVTYLEAPDLELNQVTLTVGAGRLF